MYRDHIDIIVRIQMVFSALRFGMRVLQLHSYDLWPGELPFSLGDDFICPWLKRKQNQYLKYASTQRTTHKGMPLVKYSEVKWEAVIRWDELLPRWRCWF
jgi:hypothetical protein